MEMNSRERQVRGIKSILIQHLFRCLKPEWMYEPKSIPFIADALGEWGIRIGTDPDMEKIVIRVGPIDNPTAGDAADAVGYVLMHLPLPVQRAGTDWADLYFLYEVEVPDAVPGGWPKPVFTRQWRGEVEEWLLNIPKPQSD